MDWKTKSRVLKLMDSIPYSDRVHYFIQRNVTKSLPRKPKPEYFAILDWHVANIEQHLGGTQNVNLFEFGAGWDLFYNVWLYALGVEKQCVVDLNSYVKPDLVAHEVRRCVQMKNEKFKNTPDENIASVSDLQKLGITYLAPCDARNTKFANDRFNLAISTNTMEHIPFPDLSKIMEECFRILVPGGIVSTKIDYADHYCYVDKSIGAHNYMKYSDDEWRPYNSGSHYQNRSRHSQYQKLFIEAGFEILSEKSVLEYPDAVIPQRSERADRFKDLNENDLSTTGGYFCLRKPD